MDLAEAMLRPVDDEELQHAGGAVSAPVSTSVDEWLIEPLFAATPSAAQPSAAHPHRRSARLERQRRPGAVARATQPCSSPLPKPAAPAGAPRLAR